MLKAKQMMDPALFRATANCQTQTLQQLSMNWNNSITEDEWPAVIETEGRFANVERTVRRRMKSDSQSVFSFEPNGRSTLWPSSGRFH
jgi:hypothetical protein